MLVRPMRCLRNTRTNGWDGTNEDKNIIYYDVPSEHPFICKVGRHGRGGKKVVAPTTTVKPFFPHIIPSSPRGALRSTYVFKTFSYVVH